MLYEALQSPWVLFTTLTVTAAGATAWTVLFRKKRKLSFPGVAVGALALGAIIALPACSSFLGYYQCVEKIGICPGGGGGYVCSNPNTPCAQGSGTNEDLRCKTVGSWIWGCRCSCV